MACDKNCKKTFIKTFKKALFTLLFSYVTLIAFLFFFQSKLQYVPMGKVGSVADYHLNDFSEKILVTADGVRILAWYKKPALGKKIILHFHGNAGNLGDRSFKFYTLAHNGFGVLAITYRGYSGSEGVPSEAGFMIDGQAALQFLLNEGYKPQDIIVFGESIGSGVAVPLAAEHNFYSLVLESPFSSAAAVAQSKYWFVPAKWLLKDKFESIKFADKITSPVLIFHKTRDKVVPYSEGQKLFSAIQSEKKFVTVEGVGHIDFDNEFIVDEMKTFFKEIQTSAKK